MIRALFCIRESEETSLLLSYIEAWISELAAAYPV